MCHTTTPEQMPLTTNDDASLGDYEGAVPGLGGPARGMPGQSPGNVSVAAPTKFGRAAELLTGGAYDPTGGEDTTTPPASGKLTKWGMLERVIGPALQGGLIGLAGGKGHPGGGFGAANDYFMQQRAFQMQRMLLERQLSNDAYRNSLEAARTQHIVNQPNFNGRAVVPIKAKDANGNTIYVARNPQSGEFEPVEGITPDETDNSRLEMTDQGLVSADPRTGTAKRVTLLANGVAPARIPTGPPQGGQAGNTAPGEFDSGSPRVPGTGTASQSPSGVAASAPLRPPSYSTPKASIRASRNAAGVETDNLYDANPNSPTFGKEVGALGNTRMPVPDRLSARRGDADQLGSQIETYAAEALNRNGNDPDKAIQFMNGLQVGDPDAQKHLQAILPKIRQRIRDRVKQGKKRHFLLPPGVNPGDLGLTPTDNASVLDEDDDQ